jgi:two-component system chemotaxis sensor kinase CheA
MTLDMSQFERIFLEEAQEHLDDLEQSLMEIDLEEPDPEVLNGVFRAAHSVKGGSGMFGFDALTSITHIMENLLDMARKGDLLLTVSIVDTLLSTTDTLKNILTCYRNASEIDWDLVTGITDKLELIVNPDRNRQAKAESEQGFGLFENPVQIHREDSFGFFDETPQQSAGSSIDDSFGFFDLPETATADKTSTESEVDELVTALLKDDQPPAKAQAPIDSMSDEPAGARITAAKCKDVSARAESSTIRIDTGKIDLLVNLAGEQVITQSMLSTVANEIQGEAGERIQSALSEMERNIREMQEAVMSIRMLPMSFVFNRFPRLVRDLCAKLDKKAELFIEGADTEIDKGLIEKLVDPLTHLVRNSLDHGIELPELRRQRGKPGTGKLTLKAEQKSGSILISIIDDGGGLDRELILQKARDAGIELPDQPSDEQVWHLIFAPGFSTAAQVTDVSGRGVGMDVVKRNIKSLGGHVDISSSPGLGSTFSIRLPLTLAIVDGMCVAAGDQTFVLPLVSIVESMQPRTEQIKTIGNERLLYVRDEYWPIINLQDVMDVEPLETESADSVIVLLESSRLRFGLQVDALLGQQQVVIKSLERHFRRVPGVAGATVMGDGRVALILDVESLAGSIKEA